MWAESLPPPVLNRLNFEPGVSNRCHDALMMSANLSASAILNIHGVDYFFSIYEIMKCDAVNLLQIADLIKKRGIL